MKLLGRLGQLVNVQSFNIKREIMRNQKKKTKDAIVIKPSTYQPSKAELNEPVKLNVKGRTVQKKMDNLAAAIFCGAEIRHEDK